MKMNGLDTYGLKNFYKGVVLKVMEEGKLLIHIQDLILSKPHDGIMQESIGTNNIVNSKELQITNNLASMNGIICRPLYINGQLKIPSIGDTVFVLMFDNDPKKIFYINVSNDKPKVKENFTKIKVSNDSEIKQISSNSIEIIGGKITIEWEGEEDLCGKLKSSKE